MAFLAKIPSQAVTSETIAQFDTSQVDNVMVGINVTAASGTSPTLTPFFEVLGADGVWYQAWTHANLTGAGQVVAAIGPLSTNQAVLAAQARLRLEVGGTTPSFTLSASVNGKSNTQ